MRQEIIIPEFKRPTGHDYILVVRNRRQREIESVSADHTDLWRIEYLGSAYAKKYSDVKIWRILHGLKGKLELFKDCREIRKISELQ